MKTIVLISLSVVLAACATKHKTVVHMAPAAVPGTTFPSEGMESVRYAENIKTYPLGRYVDPNDSRIMHEGHPIYRVETTAKWNLHPNQPVSSAPVIHIQDTAKAPALLRDELTVELNKQREVTKAVIQGQQTVSQKLDGLNAAVQQNRQITGENAQLQKEVNTANQRLDALEEATRQKPVVLPTRNDASNQAPPNW